MNCPRCGSPVMIWGDVWECGWCLDSGRLSAAPRPARVPLRFVCHVDLPEAWSALKKALYAFVPRHAGALAPSLAHVAAHQLSLSEPPSRRRTGMRSRCSGASCALFSKRKRSCASLRIPRRASSAASSCSRTRPRSRRRPSAASGSLCSTRWRMKAQARGRRTRTAFSAPWPFFEAGGAAVRGTIPIISPAVTRCSWPFTSVGRNGVPRNEHTKKQRLVPVGTSRCFISIQSVIARFRISSAHCTE